MSNRPPSVHGGLLFICDLREILGGVIHGNKH